MDTNDPLAIWGRVKANQYWGKRAGMVYRDGTRAIKVKKWGNGQMNNGPAGWKAKRAKKGKQ